jgi:hypothetical protein
MFVFLSLKTKKINLTYFYLKKFFFNNNKYVYILKQSAKKKKKKITVLKSPHINKKAKDSFAFYIFRINILLYVSNINVFIHLINKIKYNILLDTKIKILLYSKSIILKKLNVFLIKNCMSSIYIKLLDIVGEMNLKKILSK